MASYHCLWQRLPHVRANTSQRPWKPPMGKCIVLVIRVDHDDTTSDLAPRVELPTCNLGERLPFSMTNPQAETLCISKRPGRGKKPHFKEPGDRFLITRCRRLGCQRRAKRSAVVFGPTRRSMDRAQEVEHTVAWEGMSELVYSPLATRRVED
jgi:hypothetical protein